VAETTRLWELRWDCEEQLVDAQLALGEHRSLVADLEAAVAVQPLRERRWAQLMLVLYRVGRQADALRAFQRLCTILADDLGLQPSAEVRALEDAILLQKPELDWQPPTTGPPGLAGSQIADDSLSARAGSPTGGLVTFVFTDIEGSTRLWEQYPDRMATVLQRHDRLVGELIAAEGGQVFKTVGDAIHAVFASPTAAMRAALAVQAGIAGADWGDIGRLAVRSGVYTGEAQWVDGEWRGRSLNRCARLRDAAAGGEILSSHATIDLIGDDLANQAVFTNLGDQQLRGVTRTEQVHRVQAHRGPVEPAGLTGLIASPTDPRGAVPATLVRAARRTLIGRAAELERIRRRSAEPEGATRVVLIAGEPGVGKTRLAAAVAHLAHRDGALVLYGRCDEGLRVPYQPFVEILGAYTTTARPDALATLLGANGRELLRILPSLSDRAPGLRQPTRAEPEAERWLLFQAFAHFLHALATERPVLLVIDDLHWAEPATLLLLRHLARAAIHDLTVLATSRTSERAQPDVLIDTLADLAREHLLDTITLGGLDADDVAALVVDRLHQPADATFTETVHAESGGNPFFIHELISHLSDMRLVGVGAASWPTPAQIKDSGAPQGVRQVLVRRIGQLSPFGQEVLLVASVAGGEFQAQDVASAVGGPPEKVLAALEEVAASGLVSETGQRPGAYRFAHALVRHTSYESASSLRRAHLHWQLAQAISASTEAFDSRVNELAYHCRAGLQMGDPVVAVSWLQAAGDRSLRQVAFEEAIEHYRAAIAALDRCPDDLERRYDLLAGIGESKTALADFDASRSTWLAAADIAIELHDPARYARAVRGYSNILDVQEENHTLHHLIERGLDLTRAEDSPERALLLAQEATEMWQSGAGRPRDVREATARESVVIARRSKDPFALLAVLDSLREVLWGSSHAMEELSISQEQLQLLEMLQTSTSQSKELTTLPSSMDGAYYSPYRGLALASLKLGHRADMLEALRRAETSVMAGHRRLAHHNVLTLNAAVAAAEGRFAEAKELAATARDTGDASNRTIAISYGGQIASLRAEQGQTSRVIDSLGRLADDPSPGTMAWRTMLAGLHADMGHRDQAQEQFEKLAPNSFGIIPRDWAFPLAIRYLADLCIKLGDKERAAQLLPEVEPYTGQLLVATLGTSIEGAADRSLGQLYWALDRPQDANRHFEAAWRLEDSMEFAPLAARSRYWHAHCLSKTGDSSDRIRAQDLLENAQAAASALSMATLCRQTNRLFDQLNGPMRTSRDN
jgi:class 3 adenylate cyclase